MKLAQNLKYHFLKEEKISEEKRNKFTRTCEKIISCLEKLNLSYDGINLVELAKPRIFGYGINLGNVIKGLVLNNSSLKQKMFLLMVRLRYFYQYRIKNMGKRADEHDINFIDPVYTNLSMVVPMKFTWKGMRSWPLNSGSSVTIILPFRSSL